MIPNVAFQVGSRCQTRTLFNICFHSATSNNGVVVDKSLCRSRSKSEAIVDTYKRARRADNKCINIAADISSDTLSAISKNIF